MRRPRWLTRNVAVLSLVSFSQDAASEMLYPVLPLLLTVVLGAPAATVGITDGVAEGAASLTRYVSGRWSDRFGRRPLIGAGYGLAAAGKVLIALATTWPLVLLGRAVDRVGKGARGAPRDALLIDGVDPRDVSRVFGFHRAMDTAGAVAGPSLGLLILAVTHGNLRAALWVAVGPAVVSALLVRFVRERRSPSTPPRPAGASRSAAHPVGGRLPARYRSVVWLLAAASLVNLPDALVLLRVGQLGFTALGVTGVYILYNLVYALASYPAGALGSRWPKARVYAVGLACYATGVAGLALVRGGTAVVALMAVYGGFAACTDGVGKAWVSDLVDPPVRGRAQGGFQAATGVGVLAAGVWGGLAWNAGSGRGVIPLSVAGAIAAVAAVAMVMAGRRLG